jgi:hypothetical protein
MTTTRAREQLRQERETFDQAQRHDARWFGLRLSMGYAAIVLFLGIAVVAGCIVLQPGRYSGSQIVIAAVTLLTDMVGLVTATFKLVLPQDKTASLRPVTDFRCDLEPNRKSSARIRT